MENHYISSCDWITKCCKITELNSDIPQKISFVLTLDYTRTVSGTGAVETVTNEAQINNLDVSHYSKLTVSDILKSGGEAIYCSVIINGFTYASDVIIDVSDLNTINLKCRFYRGGVASGTTSRTVSMKITLE
ncbi:MAG: hypothetical protein K2K70_13405 [Lachnospiraceae bacterium]|nr:hypothetical protein [Lachnospiraceae bacterium]